ncbi:HSCB C-terminal oligomerization domain-containing protein [Pavlovales sp. CCMP2436]|nr:HSCB C-terminal oligomerization domain-containing protein [Pavlovales sp. CCMP2436]|mmetsp:Transcript_27775/g.69930  ORF Transcript_27775/g.69930 Transcript_27775/m.69930 type:complete len:197 (-) Transcript_27775:134-724(-)
MASFLRRAACRSSGLSARGLQALRPVPKADYFALTECERRFDLDLPALHERYKAFMVQIHPDKLASRPKAERAELASQAATLTQAMSILRDPAQRAKHLLELVGRPLGEETSDGALLSSGFLGEMLELREEVEDAGSDEAQLQRLNSENELKIQTLSARLASAFQSGDLDAATGLTAELQYLQRIQTEIAERRDAQ